ncbi:MAG: hypothetical protein Kow006_26660 [Gammaproteobacteria bacterium]
MYLEFFGLKEQPFQIAPDYKFLYLSRQHARAIAYMKYAIVNHEGFAVITGIIGSGKTTLVQKLLADIDKGVKVIRITQSQLDSIEFLQAVLRGLDQKPKSDKKVFLLDEVRQALASLKARDINTLLLVDDAQNLSNQVLEEIRLLSDAEAEHGGTLSVILVGQPELEQRLKQTGLTQLDQRVRLRFRLGPLSQEETDLYIQYRMKLAGWEGAPLFTPEVCARIYEYSSGTPRIINNLCDSVLLGAFVDETQAITVEMVDNSAEELELKLPEARPEWHLEDEGEAGESAIDGQAKPPRRWLDIYMNGELVEKFALEGETTTIGRTSENDLQLAHPSVSQCHAAIIQAGHRHFLVDLDSKHGTLVAGKPVQRHLLEMEPVFNIDPYTLVFNKSISPAVEVLPEEGQQENKSKGEKGRLKTVGA